MSAAVPAPDLDDLGREIILDHYRRPRHRTPLVAAEVEGEGVNRGCGDEVRVQASFEDGRIAEIAAQGKGCSINQASASLMTEAVQGRPLAEAARTTRAFERLLTEEGEQPDAALGDLIALRGVAKFPLRVKCALLPWKVLGEILNQRDADQPIIVSTE